MNKGPVSAKSARTKWANGFIGINASGKTSVRKVVLLVLELINNEPLNHIETRDILGDAKKVILNTYFYTETTGEICRLETVITSKKDKSEGMVYAIIFPNLFGLREQRK